MEASNSVTAAAFCAFLNCPTKAHVLAIAERLAETYFSDVLTEISSTYKSRAKTKLHAKGELGKCATFQEVQSTRAFGALPLWVDCDTAVYNLACSQHGPADRRTRESSPGGRVIPVLFSPWEKPKHSDSLLLCFGALSLLQSTGWPAEFGTLIYGDTFRRRTVRISDQAGPTNQALRAIDALFRGGQEPPLVLNKHCAVCDFFSKCRGAAMQRDDLSLLSGMTAKDRAKARAKGILTIQQLSYGYRPRRRKRTKPDAERSAKSAATRARAAARHDNKLKALAIKKGQIHVVGTHALKFEGAPTYIDVESMPDRDFYYLVGLRYESGGGPVEHTFWADGPEEEREMWKGCLRTLKSITNPQIVHYGAYETRFLRTMIKRYIPQHDDAEFVERLIGASVNLVACIYGSVYFPTYSNGLKEVGRHLGYRWNS